MRIEPASWKNALETMDRRWLAPLTKMLNKGRLRLVIATVAEGRSYRWSVSRMNMWRLWKPPAALAVPVSLP